MGYFITNMIRYKEETILQASQTVMKYFTPILKKQEVDLKTAMFQQTTIRSSGLFPAETKFAWEIHSFIDSAWKAILKPKKPSWEALSRIINFKWTIPLKEEGSLLRKFLPWSFATLTLLSLNVLNQKSWDSFYFQRALIFNLRHMSLNNDVINVLNISARNESW